MSAHPISQEVLATLVTSALTLQFAAFGYRIVREIELGDQNRRTWLLVTDYLIILSMCAVVVFCIVLPFSGLGSSTHSAVTLGSAYVIIAAHPINTAAHYRLFSPTGRSKYRAAERDVPYISDQEMLTLAATVAGLVATIYLVSASS